MIAILLLLFAVAALTGGAFYEAYAETVFQQLGAILYYVIAAVFLSAASILNAVNRHRKKTLEQLKNIADLLGDAVIE